MSRTARGRDAGVTPIPAEGRALLEGAHPAVLTTVAPSGTPRSCVMWVGLEGDEVVMTSRPGRPQVRDLARDPRAAVLVYDTARPLRYVSVTGTGAVETEGAREISARLQRGYVGPGAPARTGDLVVLRVRPTGAVFRAWD